MYCKNKITHTLATIQQIKYEYTILKIVGDIQNETFIEYLGRCYSPINEEVLV